MSRPLRRSRRSVLFALPLALAVALLAPPPAAAATKTLKFATIVPDGSVWDREIKAMAAEVQRGTQGRVVLRIYPGGVSGDDPDNVRKMRIGQLHAAALTATGLGEIDDAFQVFGMPRFYASYDELFHVTKAIEPMLARRLDEKGFVFLGWGHAGWINLFSKGPVNTPADLQKMKLFAWAGDNEMVQWWKSHGYQPVPLASTDIMTGLTTGMIDALPSPPLAALSLQWYRQTPYMLDLGVAPFVGAIVVSKKAWADLTPADQKVLRDAARKLEQRLQQAIPAQDKRAIEEMTRRGLKVTRPQGAQLEAWNREAGQFTASMRQTVVPPEVFDAAVKARDQYRAQHR